MMDFTIKIYTNLLKTLQNQGFLLRPFNEFRNGNAKKVIIVRQDVDRLPENSLQFARIQSEFGIRSTFYFRTVRESWNEKIIKGIADLGHEIGYHYEDLSAVAKWYKATKMIEFYNLHGRVLNRIEDIHSAAASRLQENQTREKEFVSIAIERFLENLQKLRQIAPINSVCMHGSPLSRWDSRLLWKYYDYNDFGIIGEPYFYIDFNAALYLTDTGRTWNGAAVSVRDKARGLAQRAEDNGQWFSHKEQSTEDRQDLYKEWAVKPVEGSLMNMTQESKDFQKLYTFHSTIDMIRALEEYRFPENAMITFHPQRWSDKTFPWLKELFLQNAKNKVKFYLANRRH